MNLKDTPIRRKLMSVILTTCAVVLVLMCSTYIAFEYYSFRNGVRKYVATLGGIIASNSSAALAFDSKKDATEILAGLKADQHIKAACLYNEKGELFAKYPDTIFPKLLPERPKQEGYFFEGEFLIGFQEVMQQGERLGTLYIKSDMETMQNRLQYIVLITALLIAIALFVAYLLSDFLQKTISGPILALEKTARVVSEQQNYAVRATKTSGDEIGALTDAFNQMLAQIEKQNQEIKQAQEAASKLAAIVESSDDAILGQTLDGIITSWNNAAERMFGYTSEEMVGESILKLVPPEHVREVQNILMRLRNGERVDSFETQRLTKNRGLLHVSVTISPVKDREGNIIGLSKIARDITEKKQEEIRKNDFIAIVSHELKTPLTSIKSYIQILLGIAKKEGSDFQVSALTKAENQVRKMTNMVQDFLSIARLEGGSIQVNKEVFELQPLVEELVSDAPFLSAVHHVRFNKCPDIKVCGDREKIGQVLNNLLSNAIKYSPLGGDIYIGVVPINGKVRISVKDNGVGINVADQKKLFNRFYRVKNEKVKNVSGFGIGLYLVSEIMKYHDSQIFVESKEGEGSTFYFDMEICQ